MYHKRGSLMVHPLAVMLVSSYLLVTFLTAACSKQSSKNKATQDIVPSSTPGAVEGEQAQQETPSLEMQEESADVLDVPPDLAEAGEAAGTHAVDFDPYIAGGPKGYIPLWQCIAPTLRPAVSDANALKTIRPDSSQLMEGLLDMVFLRQPPCVKNLLDGGADVNAFRTPADDFGDGPALHLALNQRNWTTAKYLLSRGADPNIETPYQGLTGEGGGYTALDLAYGSYAPEDIIAELKKHGAITARY
jgi:hypothetical protein